MIVITGAFGFIGSALVRHLIDHGHGLDIILVDDFTKTEKAANLERKEIGELIERDLFLPWFRINHADVNLVIHMGARTDTAEQDTELFDRLNLNYSKEIWNICTEGEIPLIYASSAATYGDGTLGFSDSDELTPKLNALNPYGVSKLDFDNWVLVQDDTPPSWYGLRFFNVFGPNEYHKKRMASVVFHAFGQINSSGKMKLFRSHRDDYENGHQRRDFIYIKDVVETIRQLMDCSSKSGIYNLGTGKTRTFLDLVGAIFTAMELESRISFIDTPADIRNAYQYFTQADMNSWKDTNVKFNFKPLEDSVEDYVQNYLMKDLLIW